VLVQQKGEPTQKKGDQASAADEQQALLLAGLKVGPQGNTFDDDDDDDEDDDDCACSIDDWARHLVGVELQLQTLHGAVEHELEHEAEATDESMALETSALLQELRLECHEQFVDAKEVWREQELRNELHEQRKMSTLALVESQERTERMMAKIDEERHQDLLYLEATLLATGEDFNNAEANNQGLDLGLERQQQQQQQQQQQCEEQIESMQRDYEHDLVELCRRHDDEMSRTKLDYEEAMHQICSEASQLRLRLGEEEISGSGMERRQSTANEHLQLATAQRNASAVVQQEEVLARAEVAAEEMAADAVNTAQKEVHFKLAGAQQDTEAARAALALQSELTTWTVLRGEQAAERLRDLHIQRDSNLEFPRMRRLLGEAEARLMMTEQELDEERQLAAWWQAQNERFLNSLQQAHAEEFNMAAGEFVEASMARDLSEHDSELQLRHFHNLLLEMRMPEYQHLPPDSDDMH